MPKSLIEEAKSVLLIQQEFSKVRVAIVRNNVGKKVQYRVAIPAKLANAVKINPEKHQVEFEVYKDDKKKLHLRAEVVDK